MDVTEAGITQVVHWLQAAERVLCITGAGISADSGLPTYRGIGGLYADNPTDDGMTIEEALSGEVLRSHPEITWKYLLQIESACRNAGHNAAHRALVELEQQLSVCVLTQNIDGFHHQAGSRNVIEIHGCFDQLRCMACGRSRTVPDYAGLSIPPLCGHCYGIERPSVVLFGEMLPEPALERLYRELDTGFDLVISIGTTSLFPYIAGPVITAAKQGIPTVEINPGDTEVSHCVDIHLRGLAAELLPDILDKLNT